MVQRWQELNPGVSFTPIPNHTHTPAKEKSSRGKEPSAEGPAGQPQQEQQQGLQRDEVSKGQSARLSGYLQRGAMEHNQKWLQQSQPVQRDAVEHDQQLLQSQAQAHAASWSFSAAEQLLLSPEEVLQQGPEQQQQQQQGGQQQWQEQQQEQESSHGSEQQQQQLQREEEGADDTQPICKFWINTGRCSKGSSCPYAHPAHHTLATARRGWKAARWEKGYMA
jgi:hypothetical protein